MKDSIRREPPLSAALDQMRALAVEILEDFEKVELWLNTPSPALGLERPIILLGTEEGARKVYNALIFWELAEEAPHMSSADITLVEFRVFEVQTKNLLAEWHLVGYDGETGEGRVSGPLKEFYPEIGQGITRTGQKYFLMCGPGVFLMCGPDGYPSDWGNIWRLLAENDQYISHKDVTFAIYEKTEDYGEYDVIKPLHVPDDLTFRGAAVSSSCSARACSHWELQSSYQHLRL